MQTFFSKKMIDILKNRYLPFLFALPLFFCVYCYNGIVFDAVLYVTQYINSVDPARFVGDPAFEFGNQGALGFFSPILGLFLEPLGISVGAFVYTLTMQVAWIVFAVFMVKALLRLTWQRLWLLPTIILFVAFFSNGMGFSHILFFQYFPQYVSSRSLSIVLGIGALALLFNQKRLPSLLFILAGTAIHPITAGWCLPFWMFYFFPKTRIPVIAFSVIFPFSFLLHTGRFNQFPSDWLKRPLNFSPDYEIFSQFALLFIFFAIMFRRSGNTQVKRISISLCLLTVITFYWNAWGGVGEHIFLYQVQPWRAMWLLSLVAVPLGVCAIKDSVRVIVKCGTVTTHDLGMALLVVSFLTHGDILLVSIVTAVLLARPKKIIALKEYVFAFAGMLLGGYLVQQYHTWYLQGFHPFFGYDNQVVTHLRDSFLVYQLVFTVGFLVFFFKNRRFVLTGLLALSIFFSQFMLLPVLPFFLFLYPKKSRFKYWGGAALIVILIVFDGVFDVDMRQSFMFGGLPSCFPWVCFATLLSFVSIYLSKRIKYLGIAIWLIVCSVVAVVNYVTTSANWLEYKVVLDFYQHKALFPQVRERGKMLFVVSGPYVEEPRLRFMTGSYFYHSVMVGDLFNREHYRTALERSHLLYQKNRAPQSDEFYEFGMVLSKLNNADTLVDRFSFLCKEKETEYLVSDKVGLPFFVENQSIIPDNQQVYLYRCP